MTTPTDSPFRITLSLSDVLVARADPPAPDCVKSATFALEHDGAELHSARFSLAQLRVIAMVTAQLVATLEGG